MRDASWKGNKLERLKDLDYIGLWGGVWMESRELCHRS